MADYQRREITTRRIEWAVPAPWPQGACWTEVQKAIVAAANELNDAGLIPPDDEPADDLIRVRPGDDEVIVSIEVAE